MPFARVLTCTGSIAGFCASWIELNCNTRDVTRHTHLFSKRGMELDTRFHTIPFTTRAGLGVRVGAFDHLSL